MPPVKPKYSIHSEIQFYLLDFSSECLKKIGFIMFCGFQISFLSKVKWARIVFGFVCFWNLDYI